MSNLRGRYAEETSSAAPTEAADATPDRQGRVVIPPRLREYAGIDSEVVVTGLNTYIEVWGTDAWSEERERVEGDDVGVEEWAVLGI